MNLIKKNNKLKDFLEVSAKTNHNVKKAFEMIAKKIYKEQKNKQLKA